MTTAKRTVLLTALRKLQTRQGEDVRRRGGLVPMTDWDLGVYVGEMAADISALTHALILMLEDES